MKAWLVLIPCVLSGSLWAQTPSDVAQEGDRLALERAQLQKQHQALEQHYAHDKRMCWQRFAVNDCLSDVRRKHHAALEPWREQELALSEQERDWRSRQREERLRGKQQGASRP